MSNNTTNHIVYDPSKMTVDQFAEKLQEMRAAAMYNGGLVINEKVTDKVKFCQENDPTAIFNSGSTAAKLTVNKHGLFFSANYGGKMKKILGLSGFAGNNARCIERAKDPNSVCAKCFSFIGSKFSNLNAWTKKRYYPQYSHIRIVRRHYRRGKISGMPL